MRLPEVIAYLQEPECVEGLRPHWEESLESLPKQDIPFLRSEVIHENLSWTGLPSDTEPILQEAAQTIRKDRMLRALAWHCERQIFQYPEGIDGSQWPSLEAVLGNLCGAFYLLTGMAVVTRTRAKHRAMKVPEQVTRDTCRVIESFHNYYQKGHHHRRIGMFRHQLSWLRRHADGLLFRIGRLEYYLTKFGEYAGGCEVYRNRKSGEVVALALNGQKMNAAGWCYSETDRSGANSCWTTSLTHTDSAVIGNPISPYGFAVQRQVNLSLKEWKRVLGQDDTVLSMHIPAGGRFTPEMFVTSMRDAVRFFSEHFPGQPSRAVASSSWIFGPALERILPDTSNLVRNMQEVYLWPIPKNSPYDGLWFIFVQTSGNGYHFDPETAEAHTSLEHAILDYVKSGGDWRCGAMFFFNSDLERFGSQYYRSSWPHWLQE